MNRSSIAICLVLFIAALVLGVMLVPNGPGMSPDSTNYIMTGDNLHNGKGFLSIKGGPFVLGAPLYPMLIAFLMLFGISSESAAGLIPIVSLALLMIPLYFLGKTLASSWVGLVTCIMCLVFSPLLVFTSYVFTEIPFMLFMTSSIFFFIKYTKNGSTRMLVVSAVFISLACLMRYPGTFLVPIGAAIVLGMIVWKGTPKKHFLIYCLVAAGPIGLWLVRNALAKGTIEFYPLYTSPQGFMDGIDVVVLYTVNDFFKNYFFDVTPLSTGNSYLALGLVLLVLGSLVAFTVKLDWLKKNYVPVLFVIGYLLTIVIVRAMFQDAVRPRYVQVVYPLLILVILSTLWNSLQSSKKIVLIPASLLVIASILTFMTFQTDVSLTFATKAREGQGINAPAWNDSPGLDWIEENVPVGAILYTNQPDPVIYKLGGDWIRVPSEHAEAKKEVFFRDLGDAYIVSFNPVFKPFFRKTLLGTEGIESWSEEHGGLERLIEAETFSAWRGVTND